MPEKQPSQNNRFIIAACALPIGVACMFILATLLPRTYIDDPRYDLLVVVDTPHINSQAFDVRFAVEQGRLRSSVTYVDGQQRFHARQLYRYSTARGALVKVDTPIPESVKRALVARGEDQSEVTEQLLLSEELRALKILPAKTAPDGYRFRHNYGGGAGFFGALFGMDRHRYGVVVEHRGRVVEIPLNDTDQHRYYQNARFLGWIDK